MINKNQDIFVQIDALLGKRGSEALSEKVAEVEDFPTLTEIIQAEPEEAMSADCSTPSLSERRRADRRTVQRRKEEFVDTHSGEMTALELRINTLIKKQQEQLEALIRQIIRDELHKILKP
jgi:hypothetical protein